MSLACDIPPRDLEPPADEPVECSQCGGQVPPEDAIGISIGDELFCDDACLRDWASDNLDVVVKRIRD